MTLDICSTTGSKVRSSYSATSVTDVALYTEPEEIYLMKKDGTVVLYDATKKTETVKISSPTLAGDNSDYQLFVNGKEQICVMQSAPEAPSGRHIDVYSYSGTWLYKINLDLFQYGLSRDESVCIYTNAAFLAAADSKRFVLFNVKNGKFLGVILIPNHLERSKGWSPYKGCVSCPYLPNELILQGKMRRTACLSRPDWDFSYSMKTS